MKTSYSALETFLTCPAKYKFQEIDKIKTPKSPEAVFGTLIHSTLKFIHSGNFLLPTEKEALNFFASHWNAEIFPDELSERNAFAQGIKIIQDYFKKNDINKIQIVDLESRFTIEIADPKTGEDHLISGFIDRIDKTENGYEIIDYKTARKLPPQKSADETRQLLIYLLAFLKRYPNQEQNLENIKLSLYFLKHGVKLTAQKTQEQLKKGQEEILEIIHQIEQSNFAPKINPLCDWCEYQKLCPFWKHKFKEVIAPSDQEKKQIIHEFIQLNEEIKSREARAKELKEKIHEIMEQEEVKRLFDENRAILRGERTVYSYDEPKLKEILSPHNKWEEILNVSSTKLKKVYETLPLEIRREIDKIREKKTTYSLVVKKM